MPPSPRLPGSPGSNHGGGLPSPSSSGRGSEDKTSDGTLLAAVPAPLKTATPPCLQPPQPPEPRANRPPVPRHPMTAMQEAFTESLVEATESGQGAKPKLRVGDVKTRREELLDQAEDDPAPGELWRYRPGQTCHELRRLMAQVSFGVYLLLHGLANSQSSVISILQGHIDEIDEFLETTLEEIDLATEDIGERIDLLKLPMDNMDVFENMLEDEAFRLQILDGNRQIEHIVSRTETALAQCAQDFAEGIKATKEFMRYLEEQKHGQWRQERPDVIDVFDAMKGNTDGWAEAFLDLQSKESALRALIVRLNGIVIDIERLAEHVSRRTESAAEQEVLESPEPSPEMASPRLQHSRQDSASSLLASGTTASSLLCPDSPPRLSLRLSTVMQNSHLDLSAIVLPLTTQSSRPPSSETPPPMIQVESNPDPIGPPPTPPTRNAARLKAQGPAPAVEVHAPDTEGVAEDGKDDDDENERPEDGHVGKELALEVLQPRTYTPQPSPLPSPRRAPPPTSPEPTTVDTTRPRLDLHPPRLEPEPQLEQQRQEMTRPTAEVPSPTRPMRMDVEGGPDLEPVLEPILEPGLELDLDLEPDPVLELAKLPASIGTPPSPEQRTMRQTSLRRSPPKTIHVPPLHIHKRPALHSSTSYQGDVGSGSSNSNVEAARHSSSLTSPRSTADFSRSRIGSNVLSTHSASDIDQGRHNSRWRLGSNVLSTQSASEINQGRYSSLTSPKSLGDFSRSRIGSNTLSTDSSYNLNIDQGRHHSLTSPKSLANLSRSRPAANVLSTHSDTQFFRPVQASPNAPLQQRPHTSHTMTPDYAPLPRNRHVPSTMGMSMTQNGGSNPASPRTLKKKRSAFKWLKKAFSLDEEERAQFEARKREQPQNLYYEPRSPRFLDGRRISPRTTTSHQVRTP